ncbi:MAG: alpha/beta hydrolase [Pirellulales bacterium]|nr:alpha/beta hydrolase [Pirellulales bacterium]
MVASFQLIFLPGLGGDARMLAPQASVFEGLVVPPWIEPERRESLPEYSARLARTVAPRPDVPLILGGVSLGGMVAYEMSRHLNPKALVLISTCYTREALAHHRRWLPLVRRLPPASFGLAKWLARPAVRLASGWPVEIRKLAVDMFRRSDSRFMSWALAALLDWHPSRPPEVPILQIHGRRDRVIPVGRVEVDRVIPDGGHLINLTHPAEVNRCVESFLEKLAL